MFAENGVGVWENYLTDRDLGVQVGPRSFGATPSGDYHEPWKAALEDRDVITV